MNASEIIGASVLLLLMFGFVGLMLWGLFARLDVEQERRPQERPNASPPSTYWPLILIGAVLLVVVIWAGVYAEDRQLGANVFRLALVAVLVVPLLQRAWKAVRRRRS